MPLASPVPKWVCLSIPMRQPLLIKLDVPDILSYPRRHKEPIMALLQKKSSFFMNVRLLPHPSSVLSFLKWTITVQFLHRLLFSKTLNRHSTLIPTCNFTKCSSPIFSSVINSTGGHWKRLFLLIFAHALLYPDLGAYPAQRSLNKQERGWRASSLAQARAPFS